MYSDEDRPQDPLVALTASIVAAYVQKHVVPTAGLGDLISGVHNALRGTKKPGLVPAHEQISEKQKPAVPVRKSITDEFIVCLEDGQSYRSLKRHLAAKYGMTPEQYRAKWGLPDDYPMVSPAYAKKRSDLARSLGLGLKRSR